MSEIRRSFASDLSVGSFGITFNILCSNYNHRRNLLLSANAT